MRMSDEKARQLAALVWRERVKRWLPLIAIALVLFVGFTFFLARQIGKADRTVDVQAHAGTVIDIKQGASGRGAAILHVHLDDGRDVEAFSALRLVPPTGAHVQINEA